MENSSSLLAERDIERINKKGEDVPKSISFKLKFTGKKVFISSSLSSCVKNLA